MRYKPHKDVEIFAKKSSLAVHINKDNAFELSIYVWNRRTNSIISHYKIPLHEHCRNSMQDVSPVVKKK